MTMYFIYKGDTLSRDIYKFRATKTKFWICSWTYALNYLILIILIYRLEYIFQENMDK